MASGFAQTFKFGLIWTFVGFGTSAMRRALSDVNALDKNSGKAASQLNGMEKAALGAAAAFAGFAASVAVMKTTFNAAAALRQELLFVQAIGGLTADQLGKVQQKAVSLATQTEFGVVELSAAMKELVRAGIDVNVVLGTMAQVSSAATIAQAKLTDITKLVVIASGALGLTAVEINEAIDDMAKVSTKTAISLSQLVTAMGFAIRFGAVTQESFSDMAVVLGLSQNVLQSASRAGTGFSNAIKKLIDPSKKGAAIIQELGITTERANGRMAPLLDILVEFALQAGDNLTITSKFGQKMSQVFGTRGISPMVAVITELRKQMKELGVDTLNAADAAERLRQKYKATAGFAEQLALAVRKGPILAFSKLGSTIEALREALGRPLLAPITFLVSTLDKLVGLGVKLVNTFPAVAIALQTALAVGSVVLLGVAIATMVSFLSTVPFVAGLATSAMGLFKASTIGVFTAIRGALIVTLKTTLGGLATFVTTLVSAMSASVGAMLAGILTSTVAINIATGGILIGIGLLVAGVFALIANWDRFKESNSGFISGLAEVFGTIKDVVGGLFSLLFSAKISQKRFELLSKLGLLPLGELMVDIGAVAGSLAKQLFTIGVVVAKIVIPVLAALGQIFLFILQVISAAIDGITQFLGLFFDLEEPTVRAFLTSEGGTPILAGEAGRGVIPSVVAPTRAVSPPPTGPAVTPPAGEVTQNVINHVSLTRDAVREIDKQSLRFRRARNFGAPAEEL